MKKLLLLIILFLSFPIIAIPVEAAVKAGEAINIVSPELAVPIPGIEFQKKLVVQEDTTSEKKVGELTNKYLMIPWINQYINGIYNFLLVICGIVAVTMVMIGGLIYATAGGNQSRVGTGQDMIVSAITGVILLFLVYTILYIINPNIVDNKGLYIRLPKTQDTFLVNEDSGNEDSGKEESFLKCASENEINKCKTCMKSELTSFCNENFEKCNKIALNNKTCTEIQKQCLENTSWGELCLGGDGKGTIGTNAKLNSCTYVAQTAAEVILPELKMLDNILPRKDAVKINSILTKYAKCINNIFIRYKTKKNTCSSVPTSTVLAGRSTHYTRLWIKKYDTCVRDILYSHPPPKTTLFPLPNSPSTSLSK